MVRAVRDGDRVLAGVGEHLELLGRRAADRTGVGLDGAELEAHSLEHADVGGAHRVVAFLQRLRRGMEGVGVLHDELAAAHHAEPRTDLVAELHLDLVEVRRQLSVALEFAAGEVGDDLFVRRADDEVALVPVLQSQQLRPVLLPTARFLPELGRLDGGHEHLERAGAVHLLADDLLDLAQRAQTERRPGVDAGGEAADEPRSQHELVADDLGFGGRLLGGVDRVSGPAHVQARGRGSGCDMLRSRRLSRKVRTPMMTRFTVKQGPERP